MTRVSTTTRRKQSGLSIVELMISVTLGLMLTGFVIGLFVSTKQTHRFNEGITSVQESGRFIMMILGHDIQMAGYYSTPNADNSLAVPNPIRGTDNTGLNGSDSITISYEGTADCVGRPVASPVVNRYDLQASATSGRSALYCNNIEILDGIDNMQLLYGEDTDNDGSANKYVSAPLANMANVVSVRLGLLLTTRDAVGSLTQTRQYDVLGVNYGPFNDTRLRRVFSTTIMLRNR